MDSSPSKRSDEGEMEKEKGCGKLKLHQAVELCVLTGITLLVWGGLTLPTVFYFVTKPTEIVGQPSYDAFRAMLANPNASSSDPPMLPPVNPFGPVNCTEGFYKEVNGYCIAECGNWQLFPKTTQITSDVFSILAICIGILAAVAVFVVAIIKHKRFLKFPAVFIIYGTGSATVFDVFVLIGYMNRRLFFCSSRIAVESYANATPFCSFIGVITWYTLLQICYWWMSHVATLFATVKFPMVARTIRKSNRVIIPHIAMVTFAVFLPLGTIIAAFPTGGFSNFRIIPPICSPQNGNVLYYGSVIPIGITLSLGIPMLISTLWIVIKQHSKLQIPGKKKYRPGTPEIKVVILLSYYMSIAVLYLAGFSALFYTVDEYREELRQYFECEIWGVFECHRHSFERFKFPIMLVVGLILVWIFPVINLVYIVSVKDIKETYSRHMSKVHYVSNGQSCIQVGSIVHSGAHAVSVGEDTKA